MPTGYQSHGYQVNPSHAKTRHSLQIPSRLLDEVMAGWCKACKATSLAPSAVHFGHYMAGMFNPTIAVFNTRLANLGFTRGYSLKQWQMGLNVILEKQAT